MQKIQMKIMALEKNLEKFSTRKLLSVSAVEFETTTSKELHVPLSCNGKVKAKGRSKADGAVPEETFHEEKVNDYVYYIVLILCLSMMYIQDLAKIE